VIWARKNDYGPWNRESYVLKRITGDENICGPYFSLVLFVGTVNLGKSPVSVNPLNFTVIDFAGRTYNLDSRTFDLTPFFDATTILPGTFASGWLSFSMGNQTPRYVVYNDGFFPVIQINLLEKLFP
jgi:hypothetical protein